MPPKKRAASDDYESDGGFVESSKKTKTKHTASSSKSVVGGGAKNEEGDEFWEISGSRRIVLSEFKGKRMVSVREFYEKDGKSLPGKKGITMTLEQFSKLVTLLPHLETVLKEKGEKLPRPDYNADPMEEDEDSKDERSVKKESKSKKNFEETSDEE